MLWVSNKALQANTSFSIWIAFGIETAIDAVTTVHTSSIFASLRSTWTGIPHRTQYGAASASWKRIAHHAFQTDTRRTIRTDDALGIVSTNHSLTLADAFARLLIFFEATFTSTPSGMTFWYTNSIRSTGQRAARVDAHLVFTSQLTRAILILVALGSTRAGTSSGIRITSSSLRTLAFVTAWFVQASGFGSARIVLTFVHIFTSCQGIAGGTCFA